MSIQQTKELVRVPNLNYRLTSSILNSKTSEGRVIAAVQKVAHAALAAFVAILETILNGILLPVIGGAKLVNSLNNRFAKKEIVDLTKEPVAIEVQPEVVEKTAEVVVAAQIEETVAAAPVVEETVVAAPVVEETVAAVKTEETPVARIPTKMERAKRVAKFALPALILVGGAAGAAYYLTSAMSIPVCTMAGKAAEEAAAHFWATGTTPANFTNFTAV